MFVVYITYTKFDVVLLCSCAELPLVFLVFKERNELNMFMYRRTARSVTMVFREKKTKKQNILNLNGFWRHNEQVSRIIRTTTIINRIWNQQSNKGFFVAAHLSISINNRIIFVLNFAQRCGVNAVNRTTYCWYIYLSLEINSMLNAGEWNDKKKYKKETTTKMWANRRTAV